MHENADQRPGLIHIAADRDVAGEIEASLATANLILPPAVPTGLPDRGFSDNYDFWRAILSGMMRPDQVVSLENFYVFEWLPRSPGLFHTSWGQANRDEASSHVLHLTGEELRLYEASEPLDPVVFDLHGKILMLQGGIGCIRLKPTHTDAGYLWFMSASSTMAAHEGVPIAITESDYSKYIEYIGLHGILPCTLKGRLKFMPEPLVFLYRGYSSVPQLYLLVEEIQPLSRALDLNEDRPTVSVAVTFQSATSRDLRYRSHQFGAAYISFSPGQNGSLESRLPWLEHYVSSLHDGTIITDFDEQMINFRGAVFSLEKVRDGKLVLSEVASVVNLISTDRAEFIIEGQREVRTQINAKYATMETIMGDVFRNIGAGATIINRSNLTNAMNKVLNEKDADLSDAISQLAQAIEKSGNQDAADNFNAFTEELQEPSPKKSLLRSLWKGMLDALPTLAELTTAAGTIALLVS